MLYHIVCGDGICNADESQETCEDCNPTAAPYCGDGTCGEFEECVADCANMYGTTDDCEYLSPQTPLQVGYPTELPKQYGF